MVPHSTLHTPCAVERPMNSHGALTLSAVAGTRTYQVVEYATAELRETLALAADGSTVQVRLEPLDARGDAWRAVGVDGGVDTASTPARLVTRPTKP